LAPTLVTDCKGKWYIHHPIYKYLLYSSITARWTSNNYSKFTALWAHADCTISIPHTFYTCEDFYFL